VTGVKDPGRVIGKRLVKDKRSGEIFRPNEITAPPRSWLAQQVPEGKVLYTMKPQPGTIPHSQLRNGDVFDVLATGPEGVRTLARNVRLVGVMGGGRGSTGSSAGNALLGARAQPAPTPVSMVVAVAPEYVYPLASIRSSDTVSIVLHGPEQAVADSRLQIDPMPTHRNVEVLAGLSKRSVSVRMTE
jgi:hypothetical protein